MPAGWWELDVDDAAVISEGFCPLCPGCTRCRLEPLPVPGPGDVVLRGLVLPDTPWLVKGWREQATAAGIVMIVPATRTEQGWWQTYVEPYRDRPGSPLTTEFLSGRIRFLRPGRDRIGPGERPPFGCCLLIWHRSPDLGMALQSTLEGEA